MIIFSSYFYNTIIDDDNAVIFPAVNGYDLNLQEASVQSLLEDSCSHALHTGPKAKIVCFSTKDFGESICLFTLMSR